jgi:hypothetical protein
MASLDTIGNVALATARVVEDPYLPEVACQLLRLNAIERGMAPGGSCAKTTRRAVPGKGIGLRYVAKPLRAAVWARQNPLAAAAVVGGAVFLIGYIGYAMGKK